MEFMFGIPSFVHFGPGVSAKLGEIATGFGAKKAFVVFDQGVKAAGLITPLIASLNDNGIETVEFDGILPNPPDTQIEEAASIARKAGVDIIVAIGGGSPIDAAKAINILLTNPSPISQYEGINQVKAPVKPLIAIPTTSGTASEVTAFSIVTDTVRTKKMVIGGQFIGATIALADPLLTLKLPAYITAATGMDALTHAIEAYVSRAASIPTDIMALKAVELISKNLPKSFTNGTDVEARSAMMLGSMLAGFAFNSAVLGLAHSIAHPLSAHFHIPHGIANAVVLPHVMKYNATVVPDRLRDIAKAMGANTSLRDDLANAMEAANMVQRLNKALDIPPLRECGVSQEKFMLLATDALAEGSTFFNPRTPSAQDVVSILEAAY